LPARYPYEYVKDSFEVTGHHLLTSIEDYINASTKVDLECPQGHIFSMSFSIFNYGHGCPVCAGNKKFTIDEVGVAFASEGYKLLTKEYINTFQKLKCVCPNGHIWNTKFYAFYNLGRRCFYCSKNVPATMDEIRSSFEKNGYKLLSKEYVTAKTKLDCICDAGHHTSIAWGEFRRGRRCCTCQYIALTGPNNPNWKGGVDGGAYCQDWTDQLKDYIKFRDGYMCMGSECNKITDKLCVHHIDYNKKSCGPENLVTVCNSCNAKANFDREWHTAWYQAILNKRYGYKY